MCRRIFYRPPTRNTYDEKNVFAIFDYFLRLFFSVYIISHYTRRSGILDFERDVGTRYGYDGKLKTYSVKRARPTGGKGKYDVNATDARRL